MGVFPAASSSHVPEPWAVLMSDPVSLDMIHISHIHFQARLYSLLIHLQKSTIIDFYPEDFKIDLNGKKFAWQGVALLPFVDEKRLFKALEPYYSCLTEAESELNNLDLDQFFVIIFPSFFVTEKRNVRGDDRLYIGLENKCYDFITGLYKNKVDPNAETDISADGMRGTVLLAEDCIGEGATLNSPIGGMPIRDNQVYW